MNFWAWKGRSKGTVCFLFCFLLLICLHSSGVKGQTSNVDKQENAGWSPQFIVLTALASLILLILILLFYWIACKPKQKDAFRNTEEVPLSAKDGQLQGQLGQIQGQLDQLLKENTQGNKEKGQLQGQLAHLQGQIERLQEEKDRLLKEHTQVKEEKGQLQGQLGQTKGQLDQLLKENAQVKEEKGQLQGQLGQTKGQLDQLLKEHEFLKIQRHKVDVSLDADTAHPRLELSQDGKSVKDTGTARSVPRTEKRFDSHTFLLAKEGYTSGKCYWEVDVGKRRNWDVGIAREPVTRKGTLTLSPEKSFWVIGLADGQDYWARTEPWTRLVVSGKPRKIGIFLDVSAKQLSFYNVSKKTAVYTFTLGGDSSQEGKFFPFFSTGSTSAKPDTEPLKIVLGFEEDHDDE